MKNNSLGKISMMTSKHPKARFNWSHDVNTTADFGSVQPTECKYMPAGTKITASSEQLYWLAPMLVRTFARLSAKTYHSFIPLSDLLPNTINSFLSQQPFSTASNGQIIPLNLPSIKLKYLSMFALTGAKLSLWKGATTTAASWAALNNPSTPDNIVYSVSHKDALGADTEDWTIINGQSNFYSNSFGTGTTISEPDASGYSTPTLMLNTGTGFTDATKNIWRAKFASMPLVLNPFMLLQERFTSASECNKHRCFLVPLGNYSLDSTMLDYTTQFTDSSTLDALNRGVSIAYDDLEKSDVVIPYNFHFTTTSGGATIYNSRRYYFCFKLSDYGKRFRKFLLGCGYQLNFQSDEYVQIMPLLATYKAYYDLFSLNLYENFENSTIGSFLQKIDQGVYHSTATNLLDTFYSGPSTSQFYLPTAGLSSIASESSSYADGAAITKFFALLGDTFYTDEQDVVSAHIPTTAVSPAPNATFRNSFVDVDGMAIPVTEPNSQVEGSNPSPNGSNLVNGHAFINSVNHGQLDSEYLKRLYRWTNRNTIIGRRIADLLRAQGLGDYVDTCKSNFIGYEEVPLKISDVTSMSDTFSPASNSGSLLGERAGQGVGYSDNAKSFTFENNEIGYWITLLTIVPKSGYCQSLDQTLLCKDKFALYNPEFDALGYEATRKSFVNGSLTKFGGFAENNDHTSQTFGYIPRYTMFKIARNLANGDFTLDSRKAGVLPYTLDRYIPQNEMICNQSSTADTPFAIQRKLRQPLNNGIVPTCGNMWRYIGKYGFIQNFNRMFAYSGVADTFDFGLNGNSNGAFFTYRDEDNFVCQFIVNMQAWSPMLPLEDSFETDDEGKTDTAMTKA